MHKIFGRFLIGSALTLSSIVSSVVPTHAAAEASINAPAPHFATLAWGMSPDATKAAMLAEHYTFDAVASGKDTDHDLWFRGIVQNTSAEITALFDADHHLVKTIVTLLTTDEQCDPTYTIVLDALTTKYGTPTGKHRDFAPPYTNADLIKAVHENKATIAAYWLYKDGGGLVASIEPTLTVEVDYESAQWATELERRKKKPDPNL